MKTVNILGGSGYTGGELLRLLLKHPEVEINQVTSRQNASKYLTQIHPHLRGHTKLKFSQPKELETSDILFLAMPHGFASENWELYKDMASTIIDLSADFRLSDPELYKQFYGQSHSHPEFLDKFAYGLVEVSREEIKRRAWISSAGCNATASILGLFPLLSHVEIDHILIDAKVGSSEAGRAVKSGSHHPERAGSIRSYQPTAHRHSAEIVSVMDIEPSKISFSATAIERIRGVLATISILADHNLSEKHLWQIYRKQYQDEPFVRLVKERTGNFRYPDPKLLDGTNYCDIGFEIDPVTNRIVIISALDNLMKGAAGQAVQAMNIKLHLDETTGLDFIGLHP